MFTDFKFRDALVPTGVPWLPLAPSAWKLTRLKEILRENQELVGDAWRETPLLALTKRGVISRDINNLQGKVPASFSGYQVLDVSDLVFCLFDVDETPRTVGRATSRGMITAAYTRFQVLSGANPQYLEMLFASLDDRKLLRPLYTGLRKSIRAADFLSTWVPMPPSKEQDAIVAYLAHAHARINKAIAAKRHLMALINEQRLFEINETVLRGLDSSSRRADSGNRFVGWIPEHWAVGRFSGVATPVQRTGFPTEELLSIYLGRGVIRYNEGGKRVHAPSIDLSNYQLVKPGDLVMNNQQAWRGSVGVSTIEGIVSPAYLVATLSHSLVDVYARYLFVARGLVDQYVVASKGVGDIQRTLHWPYLRNALVPVPPVAEQVAIAEYLSRTLRAADLAIAAAIREIDLLEEFRMRLTADVVTGQIDVRSIAAALPSIDLVEELAMSAVADGAEKDDEEAGETRMEAE